MLRCYFCGVQLDTTDKPGRSDTCSACDADLHCCRNCAFYDPGSYNECRESQADRVLEKDRSNFCDYFDFKAGSGRGPVTGAGSGQKTNPLDDLFK